MTTSPGRSEGEREEMVDALAKAFDAEGLHLGGSVLRLARCILESDALTRIEQAAEARALRSAADEWSEWETFIAGDGHRSIRQHGMTTDEWLNARADRLEDR